MNISADRSKLLGERMHALTSRLFPICRSQTGDGVRESLRILREFIPLDIHKVPTGTPVFDWEVPREWNIKDAYIADASGHRVIDFQRSNLHVVSGSVPVWTRLAWSVLKEHLTTLPEQPELIPYRTAFFQDTWGFCLSQRQFDQLDAHGEQEYEVCIDSTLEDGSLTYGELFLEGESDEEILISTHICHPSLANDGLSGLAVATFLAQHLAPQERRYSYRFLFVPATIGAITWLALNEDKTPRIKHGLVLSCLGDDGPINYRRSRQGDAIIDLAVAQVLRDSQQPHNILEFEPFGYDQRQYCSPGFDLPVGGLMRTPDQQFPEYHTSADDLSLVQPEGLSHSLDTLKSVCEVLEHTRTYLNLKPKCEPRLGESGLYHAFGSRPDAKRLQQAILWTLNLSDGSRSLLDVSTRSELPFMLILQAAQMLEEHGFLATHPSEPINPAPPKHDAELSAAY
jgi:aminopeptidase-like protein